MIIDVTRLTGRLLDGRFPTGIDRVDIEYVRRYADRAMALIRYRRAWIFFSERESKVLFDILVHSRHAEGRKIRGLVMKRFFIRTPMLSAGKILLNIGHGGLDHPEYGDFVNKYALKPIFFIHDLIPITYPEYSRPGEKGRHVRRIENALRLADGIIVNSHDTLQHLDAYAMANEIKIPTVSVAHLGVSPVSNISGHIPERGAYFVMTGTIEARKNHVMILNVWRDLVAKMGECAPRLIIIGQRGWESENAVDMLERCEKIQETVVEKNRCTDMELIALLKGARALLFPSFVEGYGLPLIEALSQGVPVIASELGVFREIAGAIPEYLDPLDGLGWQKMIIEYSLIDSPKRNEQMKRITSFQVPTWQEHFDNVEASLPQLAQ